MMIAPFCPFCHAPQALPSGQSWWWRDFIRHVLQAHFQLSVNYPHCPCCKELDALSHKVFSSEPCAHRDLIRHFHDLHQCGELTAHLVAGLSERIFSEHQVCDRCEKVKVKPGQGLCGNCESWLREVYGDDPDDQTQETEMANWPTMTDLF